MSELSSAGSGSFHGFNLCRIIIVSSPHLRPSSFSKTKGEKRFGSASKLVLSFATHAYSLHALGTSTQRTSVKPASCHTSTPTSVFLYQSPLLRFSHFHLPLVNPHHDVLEFPLSVIFLYKAVIDPILVTRASPLKTFF